MVNQRTIRLPAAVKQGVLNVRTVPVLIAILWLGSMGWLTVYKILPGVRAGKPPAYTDVLPEAAVEVPQVSWQIKMNGRVIGEATIDISRQSDGSAQANSTIRIHDLSLADLLDQSLGTLAHFAKDSLGTGGNRQALYRPLELVVGNEMQFSPFGQLEEFRSTVEVADQPDLIEIRGLVLNDELRVSAYVNFNRDQSDPSAPIFEQRIAVSPEQLIADSLTPRPRFAQLHVGQRWTYQTYRALVPNSPMMSVEAHVTQRESISWQGEEIECYHVALRRADTGGLSLASDMGHLWVGLDGTVLRQSLSWGSTTLDFERLADDGSSTTTLTEAASESP